MLEYPTVELEQKISDELMDNPALEVLPEENKNDDETDDYLESASLTPDADWAWNGDNDDAPDDDIPDYRLRTNNRSVNDITYQTEQSSGEDLAEHLAEQINVLDIDDDLAELCHYIVGNIDSDGYLRRDVERLVDDLAVTAGKIVPDEQMLEALKVIQSLDPPGVGCRDLKECLLLQLKREKPATDAEKTAVKIVEKYFDLLAKKQFSTIQQRLSASDEVLDEAFDIIQHLNPNPAANFDSGYSGTAQTITPDFIVENNDGKITVMLNNVNIPELRVSQSYNMMISEFNANEKNRTRENRDALLFAKQKVDSARWFIEAINQRNNTLLTTMNVICRLQHDFFVTGDDKLLKPMRLKDVAELTGFDISTISRVSNSKYADTEWGIIPLKHLFSEGLVNHEGEEISNKEIKLFLRETIDAEDKQNPIPDDVLTRMLNDKGYKIARRTVAKYRELLNIPVARLRRTFNK